MKHFLIAIFAFAMLAGCGKTEDETPADNTTTETATDDSSDGSTDSTDIAAVPSEDGSGDVVTTDNTTPPVTSAGGLSASDIAGEWTGKMEFDESDREVFMQQGMNEQEIAEMLVTMKIAVTSIVLNADMSGSFTPPAAAGGATAMDCTWSIIDGTKFTLSLLPPAGAPVGSPSQDLEFAVTKDRKSLSFGDPTGTTKSKFVYTK